MGMSRAGELQCIPFCSRRKGVRCMQALKEMEIDSVVKVSRLVSSLRPVWVTDGQYQGKIKFSAAARQDVACLDAE